MTIYSVEEITAGITGTVVAVRYVRPFVAGIAAKCGPRPSRHPCKRLPPWWKLFPPYRRT